MLYFNVDEVVFSMDVAKSRWFSRHTCRLSWLTLRVAGVVTHFADIVAALYNLVSQARFHLKNTFIATVAQTVPMALLPRLCLDHVVSLSCL